MKTDEITADVQKYTIYSCIEKFTAAKNDRRSDEDFINNTIPTLPNIFGPKAIFKQRYFEFHLCKEIQKSSVHLPLCCPVCIVRIAIVMYLGSRSVVVVVRIPMDVLWKNSGISCRGFRS